MEVTWFIRCGHPVLDIHAVELDDMRLVNCFELMAPSGGDECDIGPLLVVAWQHAVLTRRAGPPGLHPPPDDHDFQVIHDALSPTPGGAPSDVSLWWPPVLVTPESRHRFGGR